MGSGYINFSKFLENPISNVNIEFIYNYFTKDEQTSNGESSWVLNSNNSPVPSKFMNIKITTPLNIGIKIGDLSKIDINSISYKDNWFFSTDLRPFYSKFTNPDFKFFNMLENEEETIQNIQTNSIILKNNVLSSVINNSNIHGFSDNISNETLDYVSQIQEKFVNINKIFAFIEFANNAVRPINTTIEYKDLTMVGYYISKYDIKSNKLVESFMMFDSTYEDWNVYYGIQYQYNIRPIYILTIDQVNNNYENILIVSEDTYTSVVESVEAEIPFPPANIKFNLVNKKLKINWEYEENKFSYNDGSVNYFSRKNDIKGLQLFLRNSLQEPYRLYKHFNFNDTEIIENRIRSNEMIPQELIVNLEDDLYKKIAEYTIDIKANTNYYIAMCCIDAHGNSSNYSVQYMVRRNNITGELIQKYISKSGAPKQFPNMLLNDEIAKSSFKVSNYKNLKFKFNPDTLENIPDMETTNGEELIIQLIDVLSGNIKEIKYNMISNTNT